MNVCDGNTMNKNPFTLPTIGKSGIAMNISAVGIGLIPDMREDRRGLPFARVNILT
jgi:hypothetical protein